MINLKLKYIYYNHKLKIQHTQKSILSIKPFTLSIEKPIETLLLSYPKLKKFY